MFLGQGLRLKSLRVLVRCLFSYSVDVSTLLSSLQINTQDKTWLDLMMLFVNGSLHQQNHITTEVSWVQPQWIRRQHWSQCWMRQQHCASVTSTMPSSGRDWNLWWFKTSMSLIGRSWAQTHWPLSMTDLVQMRAMVSAATISLSSWSRRTSRSYFDVHRQSSRTRTGG